MQSVQDTPQLFSTIKIVNVVVTIEQPTIFRNDLLFLFNNLNIILVNSNSFIRVQVRIQKKYFFEFKFEFGKMIEFFRVSSPGCKLFDWVHLVQAVDLYQKGLPVLP